MDDLTGASRTLDAATLAARSWDEHADDRLRLVFTCAHPALAMDARVALTLHTVGGLTTGQIARAFLVSEPTMAQRLVRAKRRIRGAGIPYRVPEREELPARLDGVLAVLYLIFTEGHSATSGADGMRIDLAAEAIALLRLVLEVVPADAADEARALLGLLLLHDARRAARVDGAGDLVPFEEQDRSAWDRAALAEAEALLAAPHGIRGGYRVQAELAAAHVWSADPSAPDWARIVALYDELATFTSSPMVALNRAIARGFAEGYPTGLADLAHLAESGDLASHHLLPAAQADLLRRSGDRDAATAAYRRALDLAPTEAERRYLRRRLLECGPDHAPS
jgi:RNA polymerase sigma-70 factor (ECF subfamily)